MHHRYRLKLFILEIWIHFDIRPQKITVKRFRISLDKIIGHLDFTLSLSLSNSPPVCLSVPAFYTFLAHKVVNPCLVLTSGYAVSARHDCGSAYKQNGVTVRVVSRLRLRIFNKIW